MRRFLIAFLLLLFLGGVTWDLKDIRQRVSQDKMGRPFYAENYRIYLKIGEIQGLIDQGTILQARTRMEEVEKEALSYRGSYPDYLHFEIGLLLIALNENEKALNYLEKAVAQSRKKHLKDFLQHPSLTPLKTMPKFIGLIKS